MLPPRTAYQKTTLVAVVVELGTQGKMQAMPVMIVQKGIVDRVVGTVATTQVATPVTTLVVTAGLGMKTVVALRKERVTLAMGVIPARLVVQTILAVHQVAALGEVGEMVRAGEMAENPQYPWMTREPSYKHCENSR
jgi:hypothetical protein